MNHSRRNLTGSKIFSKVGSRLKRLLKLALKLAVTVTAFYFVIRNIDVSEIADLYRTANIWLLLLALMAFVLSKAVNARRLNLYFAAIDVHLEEKTNMQLYLLGMFYNLFLPGGIGGDGYKVYLLQKYFPAGTKKVLGAVLTDRISGMVVLVVLALLGFALLKPSAQNFSLPTLHFNHLNLNPQHLTLLLIPLAFLAYYLFIKYIFPYFLRINLVTFGYGFIVQFFQLLCAWLILMALGVKDYQFEYLVIFLVSSIVTVLPISIGGIGIRELTFLYGSQLLNVDVNVAVGISFLFYLITALVSLAGIYYVFRPISLTSTTP